MFCLRFFGVMLYGLLFVCCVFVCVCGRVVSHVFVCCVWDIVCDDVWFVFVLLFAFGCVCV